MYKKIAWRPDTAAYDCVKVVLQNIKTESECFIVFMSEQMKQLLIKL